MHVSMLNHIYRITLVKFENLSLLFVGINGAKFVYMFSRPSIQATRTIFMVALKKYTYFRYFNLSFPSF